ncbi:MAG: TonB-dependent receptor plug domain-containing protein [Saprospiraceae bacterium]|nr:TonB-dependent receptor plug domain-containing protein [Saprospiraceae bacterium]
MPCATMPNVYVQKSQMGGGSPVIRGFEANKILLVVDGVRMNNAIYRSGHLQNVITIDPTILEQIEVIYGPGSLLYGSDALGGVVHLRSRMPQLQLGKENNTDLNYVARYATANNERAFHLDYNYARNRWASLTSISYYDFDDLRAGSKRTNEFPDFGKRLFFVETDLSDENKFDFRYS